MAQAQSRTIFNTVPKKDIFGFYDEEKRIKYKAIAKTLELRRHDISRATRVSIDSVRYEEDKIPGKMKDFLRNMIWLLHVTHEHLKDKHKVIQWINSPNPVCGGLSPKDLICMGQYKKLVKIVASYTEGDIP